MLFSYLHPGKGLLGGIESPEPCPFFHQHNINNAQMNALKKEKKMCLKPECMLFEDIFPCGLWIFQKCLAPKPCPPEGDKWLIDFYIVKRSSASTMFIFSICGTLLSTGKREMKIFGLNAVSPINKSHILTLSLCHMSLVTIWCHILYDFATNVV